jgi:hypothetical protein
VAAFEKKTRGFVEELTTSFDLQDIVIEIGGLPVLVRTADTAFLRLLGNRYAGFLGNTEHAEFEFDVELTPPGAVGAEDELRVLHRSGRWSAERGDLRAEWDPASNRGGIRQSANPYSIDAVLRIVHTLVLSRQGGFLVHAASAVRNGRAFLFAGVSGAGKTTMARMAPEDAILLSDEISYVKRQERGYSAFGTPFTGELAKVGENTCAPIAALYLLAKGPQNQVEPVARIEAARALLANILFFAKDPELVRLVFQSACEFVGRVPVCRLTFVPDASVWEMIA